MITHETALKMLEALRKVRDCRADEVAQDVRDVTDQAFRAYAKANMEVKG